MPIKIHVIAEGYEEVMFLDIVTKFHKISSIYELSYEPACGYSFIPAIFQYRYMNRDYDYVFAMYDADNYRNDAWQYVNSRLLKIFGDQEKVNAYSLVTNPNTIQLIATAVQNNLNPISTHKEDYSEMLQSEFPSLYGTYQANEHQREIIKEGFDIELYEKMIKGINGLSSDIKNFPSTTMARFLNGLSISDPSWLK